ARPKVHIFYMREAYVSDNDQVRVTMDRQVLAEPNLTTALKVKMRSPVQSFLNEMAGGEPAGDGRWSIGKQGFTKRTPHDSLVILELKFTNRFPTWFGDLVRTFHCMQCGAAKYVESVQGIGSGALKCPFPVNEE